jgi:hypothetical protein
VLANDADPDGDPLTVSITTQTFVGTDADRDAFHHGAAAGHVPQPCGDRPAGQNVAFPVTVANTGAADRTYAPTSGVAVPVDGPAAALLETAP